MTTATSPISKITGRDNVLFDTPKANPSRVDSAMNPRLFRHDESREKKLREKI
jgi:hypothetical protein